MYISGETSTLICQRIIQYAIDEIGTAAELCNVLAFNSKTVSNARNARGKMPSRVVLTIIYWLGPEKAAKMLTEIMDDLKAKGIGTIDDYIATTERNKQIREQRLAEWEKKHGVGSLRKKLKRKKVNRLKPLTSGRIAKRIKDEKKAKLEALNQ